MLYTAGGGIQPTFSGALCPQGALALLPLRLTPEGSGIRGQDGQPLRGGVLVAMLLDEIQKKGPECTRLDPKGLRKYRILRAEIRVMESRNPPPDPEVHGTNHFCHCTFHHARFFSFDPGHQ